MSLVQRCIVPLKQQNAFTPNPMTREALPLDYGCQIFHDEIREILSVDPSKSSPPNVSIYNSVHVAIGHPDTNSTQAVNTAKIIIGLK